MSSHHFIGVGLLTDPLRAAAADPERLLGRIAGLVTDSGLRVVTDQSVRFDNEGSTLVWILAESHLVLHVRGAEGFTSIDLHVCDYQGSNRDNAKRLVASLAALCFVAGSERWNEIHLGDPVPEAVAEA